MKLYHVFATWIILWFSFLILRVNYTVKEKGKKKKKKRNYDINTLAAHTLITVITEVGLTQSASRIYTEHKYGRATSIQ